MSLQDLIEKHIAKLGEINQNGIDFAKRVAEHHVEVIERNLKPEMQIAAKVVDKPEEEEKPVA